MKMKNEKGITMVSLIITVIVLTMLGFTITMNASGMIKNTNINELEGDIELLEEKVEAFYRKYGEIPALIEYKNISHLISVLNNIEKGYESEFYVIDLQAMKGITLNYGKDYETVRKMTETSKDLASINNFKDLYIINNITHNIFYVQGININGKTRFTNYLQPKDIPN